jgi:hypothetical protein
MTWHQLHDRASDHVLSRRRRGACRQVAEPVFGLRRGRRELGACLIGLVLVRAALRDLACDGLQLRLCHPQMLREENGERNDAWKTMLKRRQMTRHHTHTLSMRSWPNPLQSFDTVYLHMCRTCRISKAQ